LKAEKAVRHSRKLNMHLSEPPPDTNRTKAELERRAAARGGSEEDWAARVQALPGGLTTDIATQNAMQNAHDRGLKEGMPGFWKAVHGEVVAGQEAAPAKPSRSNKYVGKTVTHKASGKVGKVTYADRAGLVVQHDDGSQIQGPHSAFDIGSSQRARKRPSPQQLLNAEFTPTEKAVYAPVTPGEGPRHQARATPPAAKPEVQLKRGASGNYQAFRGAEKLGIIIPQADGSFSFEHKRGDQVHGYASLSQAAHALVQRHDSGQSIGGRGETLRSIGMPETRKGGRRRRGPDYRGIGLSVETPRLVATPAPLGKPGGPGLYHLKGAKLPNYIENMRNALMRGGMSEGRATATAISRCKVLAVTSKHPEVKAAAAAAIAELKATALRAKAAHGHTNSPSRVVELFNMFHAPPGAGGGQFTTKSGASGGAKAQPGTTPSGTRPAAQKAAILRTVAGLRKRIGAQTVTLNGLKAQKASLSASVGGSKASGTTVARKAKKATTARSKTTVKQKAGAKRKATTKTTGASKASSRAATMGQIARLSTRISSLSSTIRAERGQVRTLLAKARKM
jgi:hypothetical protein